MTSTNPTGPSTGETPTAAPLPETPLPTQPRPRKTQSRWGGCLPWLVVLAVLLTGFAIWKFPSFKAQAELGSAYAARVGCSCRYVQGRSLDSCQSDFEPGMELIMRLNANGATQFERTLNFCISSAMDLDNAMMPSLAAL